VYAAIREWRKETADREGLYVYNIMNNRQMAEIARLRLTSKDTLQNIDGIGEKRCQKYGDALIEIVKRFPAPVQETAADEKTAKSDAPRESVAAATPVLRKKSYSP